MSVKLSNFVQIVIKKHLPTSIATTRDTAVLVDSTITEGYYKINGTGDGKTKASAASPYDKTGKFENEWFEVFFKNGGKVLHVVKNTKQVPRNEILIAFTNGDKVKYGNEKDDDIQPQDGFGPDTKIYVLPITSTPTATTTGKEGIVYKYEPEVIAKEYKNTSVMATLAYYTKMRIYDTNAAKDYAFTVEVVDDAGTAVTDDNDVVNACILYNANCLTYLAGATRNIGGNDSMGNDLTNYFMRIVLQQTLTDNLVALLTSKIKYDERGVNSVIAVISAELTKFVNNGYISTDKSWTDEDLYIGNELIIAQGAPLIGGFKIHVAGFDTLTKEERDAHQFPEIYILYGDAYSIRKIAISGEVFY